MASIQRSALFEAIQKHDSDSISVVHSLSGRTFKYGSLVQDVANAKARLLQQTDRDEKSIVGERVAFLAENSYDYVGAQLFETLAMAKSSIADHSSQSPF